MDENKCPMCGKSNPAEAEVCEFCQARLKPLILGGQEDSNPADWLSGLRLTGDTPSSAADSTPPAPDDDSSNDWLSRIRARHQAETPEEESAEGDQESISDWLAGLRSGDEPAADEDESLSRLFTGQSSETPLPAEHPQAGIPEPAEESTPEPFIKTSADSEEMLDWLSGLQSETPPAAGQSSEPESTQAEAGEDLGWLSAFQQETPPTSGIPIETEATPAGEGEDLGWMNAFQEASATPVETPANAEDESPAMPEETPGESGADFDWLTDLMQDQTPAQSGPVNESPSNPFEESTEIQTPEPDALPDWLVQLQQTPAREPAEPPSQAEQPTWLQEMMDETLEEDTTSAPFTIPIDERPEVPAENPVIPAEAAQEIPDWLSNLPEDHNMPLSSAPAFLPEDQLSQPLSETTDELFPSEDLPDWIAEEATVAEPGEKVEEEVPAEELEPAQLPTWLQTMRPVEAAAPIHHAASIEDNRVEKAGPLAGLRGLVNGSETVTQYHKPPTYTTKLQVTDRQRMHATLLENVLSAENQAGGLKGEKLISPQRILRVVVTLLLLAALLIPIVLHTAPVLPSQDSTSVDGFIGAAGEILPGDNILLAVEYDTGLAAEMEATAHDFLTSLEEKNTLVTMISTNPSGPVLAEALLSSAWSEAAIQGSSANMGYIAGGSTALAQLAASSLQQRVGLNYLAAQPYRLPGAWPIQQYLSQYKAVIVLTDNVDTGRAWVEQISSALRDTPLLIISSAQAGPILQAYTGAQVKSLMSGNNPSAAYQSGMLVTTLLIIIGGVVQGMISLAKRPRKPEEK